MMKTKIRGINGYTVDGNSQTFGKNIRIMPIKDFPDIFSQSPHICQIVLPASPYEKQ